MFPITEVAIKLKIDASSKYCITLGVIYVVLSFRFFEEKNIKYNLTGKSVMHLSFMQHTFSASVGISLNFPTHDSGKAPPGCV